MQNDRAIAGPTLAREEEARRELGITGVRADGEDRPGGGCFLRAHVTRSEGDRGRDRRRETRESARDGRDRHEDAGPLAAGAARLVRHATQTFAAPKDTCTRRTSEPCRWASHRI